MSHMFFITGDKIEKVNMLFRLKREGQYVVLNEGNGFSDIAQWVDKYQNVKILTVPTYKLEQDKAY